MYNNRFHFYLTDYFFYFVISTLKYSFVYFVCTSCFFFIFLDFKPASVSCQFNKINFTRSITKSQKFIETVFVRAEF